MKDAVKLREMWECKEGHKARARDLTIERDGYKEDIEKYTGVRNELIDDNAKLQDDLIGANEENKELVESMNKMKIKHKLEKDKLIEKYNAQCYSDSEKLISKDIKISQLENMRLKAQDFYSKKMKEENGLRTKAEKDVLDFKAALKAQKKTRDLENEVFVWRKMCTIFWIQDPTEVYDPNNPPPVLTETQMRRTQV